MASYPRHVPETHDPGALRAIFDAVEPLTVGLEEEAVLADPVTLAPLPRATEVLERLGGDPRFKLELPVWTNRSTPPRPTRPRDAAASHHNRLVGARAQAARWSSRRSSDGESGRR